MSYKLFLDDKRLPKSTNWTLVKTFREFTDYIKQHGIPEAVSFDHDLGQEYHIIKNRHSSRPLYEFPIDYQGYREKTGYHCAKWLVARCMHLKVPFPRYYLHTDNPVGRENMKSIIETYNKFFQSTQPLSVNN